MKKIDLKTIKNFIIENYKDETLNTINKYPDEKHITIDYKALEEYNYDLADILIKKPEDIINSIQNVIYTEINTSNKNVNLNIRFKNIPYTPLEDLLNDKIGQLIETEARVINLTDIRPIIKTTVFECKGCMKSHYIEQDLTNKNIIFPSLCNECGGKSFRLLKDDSIYEDTRILIVAGLNLTKSNNRRLNILLKDDLIYKAKGGEHIKITGILKVSQNEKKSEYYIDANNIEPANNKKIEITDEDKKQLKELSEEKNIITKLGHSITPDLILDDEIKTALLCYIVKGIKPPEKDTGLYERDYINIMIVTEPATGKTQLGEAVINCCENGIMTSGTSSTEAGLIGAAVPDKINGGYTLEIGAIPMANNGHCLIDEFDKLDIEKQNDLLSPMESGKETITKATIYETVQCRTGLLLLANPINGKFDKYKPSIIEQIKVTPPLLSRCDLLLAIQNEPDKEKDRKIATKILKKYNNSDSEKIENNKTLDRNTLKKYLKYASELNPVLSKETQEYLINYYVEVKSISLEDGIPLDPRVLNSLIRFSSAIAKLKLKDKIDVEDCKEAIKLFEYSLKQFGYDPETGKIDISRVTGEPTRADKRNRIKIMEIIKDWINTNNNLYILKPKLLESFIEDTGKSKDTFYNAYNQLKNAGDIIEKQKKVYIKIK